jgi:two-component system chemotaxis response regulator CheY
VEQQTYPALKSRLGRVLVVDDEANVRRLITITLTKSGYDVVEAEDGGQAIAALNAGDNPLMVDTILCDIRMPRINGLEAIEYFRSQYPSVPVVVLTGYPDVELAVALMKKGVLDYLVKPVSKEELVTVIQRSVQEHRILKDQFVA